jgi:hypothetical protein
MELFVSSNVVVNALSHTYKASLYVCLLLDLTFPRPAGSLHSYRPVEAAALPGTLAETLEAAAAANRSKANTKGQMNFPVRRMLGLANKYSVFIFVIPWGVLESYLYLEQGGNSRAELVRTSMISHYLCIVHKTSLAFVSKQFRLRTQVF